MLGIIFSTDLHSMVLRNYNRIILSIRKQISHWSKRVTGRVTVVKSLLVSKLTYLICTIPDPPKDIVTQLNVMLFNFIWKGQDRVTINQMIQDYNLGGLKNGGHSGILYGCT